MICIDGVRQYREKSRNGSEDLDFRPGRIVEVHILELDMSLNTVGSDVATVIVDSGDAIKELKDTSGGSDGLHELGEDRDEGGECENGLKSEKHV